MPLLTPDLAASASSVSPRCARWARTLLAMAWVIVSGSSMQCSVVNVICTVLHSNVLY